jgi:Flp pilus assembly secretin CpaC
MARAPRWGAAMPDTGLRPPYGSAMASSRHLRAGMILIGSVLLAPPHPSVAQAAEAGESRTEPGGASVDLDTGDAENRVTVEVGAQTILDAPGVVRVSIGDPAVADIQVVEGHEILVTGVAHGRTSLHVWYRDREARYVVDVTDEGRGAEMREAVALLGLADVIRVQTVGRRIVIDGEIATLEAYERYRRLVKSWPELVDLVRIDPAVIQELVDRINAALEAAEVEGVEVRAIGGTLFVEGAVTDRDELERVMSIIRAIHGQIDPSGLRAPAP